MTTNFDMLGRDEINDLEAILSIQAGDNPRMLQEKLETFLPPAERGQEAPAKALAPGFFDPVADLLTVSDLITITKDGLAAIAVVVDKTEPVILRALMS